MKWMSYGDVWSNPMDKDWDIWQAWGDDTTVFYSGNYWEIQQEWHDSRRLPWIDISDLAIHQLVGSIKAWSEQNILAGMRLL